ncbi:hypothetical protein XhyaCFBP1156_05300 [Xanthomonas hyacinthi]|uniref:Uncharacterized protein n=1 Tax=Xanthomonas hyacinthi TaxID=56455 RepID=A0A2S7F037_9XANT|nr:hypothetical protein XhyaCFBP1156_05300 [Xanthomonas hyacinthi]
MPVSLHPASAHSRLPRRSAASRRWSTTPASARPRRWRTSPRSSSATSATHILAFEGDSHVAFLQGSHRAYEADKRRRMGDDAGPKRLRFEAAALQGA